MVFEPSSEYARDAIQKQVHKKLNQKYNWKRTVASALEALERRLIGTVYNCSTVRRSYMTEHHHDDAFGGIDEYGRDIGLCLRQYALLLRNRGVKLHSLILLGSRAKGRSRNTSDVDVVVVASNLPGKSTPEFTNIIEKILNIRRYFLLTDIPLFVGVDATACSKEEFLRWLHRLTVFALDTVCYGKVIYDDGFWNDAHRDFELMKKRYDLTNTELRRMLYSL